MVNLVECVKLRPRTQSLCISTKDVSRSSSAVNNNDGNIAKLDLINWSVLLGPLAIFFRSVYLDVSDISNQG